jgi:hypothetical protein
MEATRVRVRVPEVFFGFAPAYLETNESKENQRHGLGVV